MSWSFRKFISFGPLRLNFSKSGVSVSLGVKGARITKSKRGTFLNAGMKGLYYRKKIK